MLRLIIVSMMVALTLGQITPYIVGGINAVLGQFPHQVSLRIKSNNYHFCGGSIINNRWILTAAHCTIDKSPASIIIVAGTTSLSKGSGVTYTCDEIKNHLGYIPVLLTNDISVVKTGQTILKTDDISAIPLGSSFIEVVSATASGWGSTTLRDEPSSKTLQVIETTTMKNEDCLVAGLLNVKVVVYSTLCTLQQKGEGICTGDSGGPLIYNGVLIGVASFTIGQCAGGYPDGWARVSSFITWIINNAT